MGAAMAKLESGDASVSLSTVLSVIHTLGLLPAVVEAFDPMHSDLGAALIGDELPKRVRSVPGPPPRQRGIEIVGQAAGRR